MSKTEVEHILKDSKLRLTPCRLAILDYFMGTSYALSNAMIEDKLQQNFDRVTIYRTLKSFQDKGIIHRVLDDEGSPKYALCHHACDEHAHKHNHVHLKCMVCGETNCIESVEVPPIQLPEGYSYSEADVLLQGICSSCS
jgi:Fur family transcriptional regulator, ferric uptake regulator